MKQQMLKEIRKAFKAVEIDDQNPDKPFLQLAKELGRKYESSDLKALWNDVIEYDSVTANHIAMIFLSQDNK